MSGAILHLPETRIDAVERTDDGALKIAFQPALVVKSEGIPLTDASTLWTQNGVLTLSGLETDDMLTAPVEIVGGSVEAGGVRYVDMLPLPFTPHGPVELSLTLPGGLAFRCTAEAAVLEMAGNAKYLRHLDQD